MAHDHRLGTRKRKGAGLSGHRSVVAGPRHPTTGSRELEMILEAAPLRGLITRPRGSETTNPSGITGQSGVYALGSGPISATKFAPESRRRLQGTLLNCNLYKRSPAPSFREAGALSVHFTATVGGDPHGIVRTSDNFAALAQSLGKTLRLGPTDRLLCAVALHHSYGFDFGLIPSMAFGAPRSRPRGT